MTEVPHYTRRQYAKRCCALVAALFVMACGIAMSKLAELGTTPISCIPAVLSCSWMTIGTWTVILNTALVGLEAAVLGRRFRRFQLLQISIAFLLGTFTDIWMELLSFVDPTEYAEKWFWCVLSVFILGLGVFMEVRSDILVAPGEGFVLAVSTRFRIPFPRMKVVNDVCMVTMGTVLSIATLGTLRGVREGTVFAAVALGTIVGFYKRHLSPAFDRAVA